MREQEKKYYFRNGKGKRDSQMGWDEAIKKGNMGKNPEQWEGRNGHTSV